MRPCLEFRTLAVRLAVSVLLTSSSALGASVMRQFEPSEQDTKRAEPLGSASDPEEPAAEAAPTGPETYPPAEDTQPALPSDAKRPVPAYAPVPPPSTGEELLWVPRVLLFPLYVVSEYGIRWPLTRLFSYAEEHYWPQHVVDFFSFGPHNEALLYPIFYVDLGLRPQAGLYFSWHHALAKENSMRVRLDTGGTDSFRLRVSERYSTPAHDLGVSGGFSRSPDRAFRVLGPESPRETFRYGADVIDAHFLPSFSGWRSSKLQLGPEFVTWRFDPNATALGGTSLTDAVEQGRLTELPAGIEGYTAVSSFVRAALDTRRPRRQSPRVPASDFVSPPGSGVRLAGHAKFAVDLRRAHADTAREWVNYGGVAAAFLDLNGRQRTVGVALWADLVDPISGGSDVPFTELPSLGGSEPMPGLRPRRLVDQSSIAAQLDYRWPVWVSLDGTLTAALGNVFGRHLEGFDPALLRASFALGLRTNNARDHAFEFLVGAGTEPFRDGAHLEEIRFATGTTTSF